MTRGKGTGLRTILVFIAMFSVCAATATASRDPSSDSGAGSLKESRTPAKGKKGKPVLPAVEKAADSHVAEKGDVVRVNYTVTLENGEVYVTTVEEKTKDPAVPGDGLQGEPKSHGPDLVIAGERGSAPGLGEGVLGMKPGDRKKIDLSPEKAYGVADKNKKVSFPCVKRVPIVMSVSPMDYVQKFQTFPVVGQEVEVTPFFKGRILEVTERSAKIEALAQDGQKADAKYGTTEVTLDGDEVVITLTPVIGSPFEVEGQKGFIEGSDGEVFTVDFNDPMAGKRVSVEMEVLAVTKGASLAGAQMHWVENYDEGLRMSSEKKKPAVLVLYAGWCKWSKKLLEESFNDPRVRMLEDRFVCIRVDSDAHKEYAQKYEQEGFPTMLLLKPDGQIAVRLDGFKDGNALYQELSSFLKTSI